jgi:predicted kinase
MIFYYNHKSINDLTTQELDLLGFDGIFKYAQEHNMDPNLLFEQIKCLETDIRTMGSRPFDMTHGSNRALFNEWTNKYIDFFNRYAKYEKQAYIILGNIASGKSTFAKSIEEETGSIIIDPDRYKMGEMTEHGYFEGFTSLYKQPTDRERLQDPCSDATKQTLAEASNLGMNIIMPKATTSYEKLEKQLQVLMAQNYDIHLILFESPIQDCANRNYFRYLVKEYAEVHENGIQSHGRFVPVSVITNIGDGTFTTFAKAHKTGRFKSYKAYFNSGSFGNDSKRYTNEEIDLETMGLKR